MFWYEEEVQHLEQKVGNLLDASGSVVFYGSSSIRLWETLAQDFPTLKTLNLGFGGSTLAACTWFFERIVVPANPQAIIFYAGDNDLGDGRLAEEVYLFFCSLHQKVREYFPEVPLTFLSIKPSPVRWSIIDRIRYANSLIAKEIENLPYTQYIDINTKMLNTNGLPRQELFDPDGLHMNRQGYEIWKRAILDQAFICQQQNA
ncbi:MAG: SGNH/GDSL hydrolase family protein [Siphonobacter sp.]